MPRVDPAEAIALLSAERSLVPAPSRAARLHRVCVKFASILTHMTKTQVYLPDEDLEALRSMGKRTGRSVADLVREAVRRVWLRPDSSGPVALWDGTPAKTSLEHDGIYDEA